MTELESAEEYVFGFIGLEEIASLPSGAQKERT